MKIQSDETILFEGKPQEKIFVEWILTKIIPACFYATFITVWFILFFGSMLGAAKHMKEPLFYLLPPALVFLVPLVFVCTWFYYRNLLKTYHYYITSQRCVFEGGIFVRRSRSVPFYKITDVEINQNILDRLLNLSSLKIFTAGTGSMGVPGFEKAELVFWGLTDVETPASAIQKVLKSIKATGE